ncbi:rhodanese-related sulfurtransferase [Melghiribacillus thermohalophilus]|uniref:Rhodanese-related sulfurtransferase n=1 Tax=Melghiribacillus thermohalophilus TaxID=1324956 RepID=A0A4R3MT68_9BACI|nr:rhodanese-like domain-containing protein [Melghiribacillus thermohalophilus]TCT18281.1 rhodanese-related sulfurtransferase [Melghiribacillus thermohalophilus]
MKKIARALLGLIFVLGACSTGHNDYETITMDEAKKIMDHENVQVIDVRTQPEYDEGHIPGAVLIPLQELESRLDELEQDNPYIIVCRSGNRSQEASQMLVENGFTKIYNTSGGMKEWKYDIEK